MDRIRSTGSSSLLLQLAEKGNASMLESNGELRRREEELRERRENGIVLNADDL